MAFRARNVFATFEKRVPGRESRKLQYVNEMTVMVTSITNGSYMTRITKS